MNKGKKGVSRKSVQKGLSLKKRQELLHTPLEPRHSSAGRQLLVLAVAIAMLVSVVGTFVVLQELSQAEELVDSVRAHQALNAMVVKQIVEEQAEEQEVLSSYYQEDGGEYGESFE